MNATDYRPPFGFRSAHLQTIYPTLFRRVPPVTDLRERIETADGDFIDLDWARSNNSQRLVVITHGLEGHSQSVYCQGMARALQAAGWDVLAWNFRGCSGEPNRVLRSYHSGATSELQIVLDHIFATTAYAAVSLVGFSLGGNLTLKYIGDLGAAIDQRICGAVGVSIPCDLASSAKQLERWQNRIYMARFMRTLREKVREKAARFPGVLDLENLNSVLTFAEFDDRYTGPIHGFEGADDYWRQSSCLPVLGEIKVPTLLINAQDDPFLTLKCFPHEAVRSNPCLDLETPKHGGHLGFVSFGDEGFYWSEQRAIAFLENVMEGLAPSDS